MWVAKSYSCLCKKLFLATKPGMHGVLWMASWMNLGQSSVSDGDGGSWPAGQVGAEDIAYATVKLCCLSRSKRDARCSADGQLGELGTVQAQRWLRGPVARCASGSGGFSVRQGKTLQLRQGDRRWQAVLVKIPYELQAGEPGRAAQVADAAVVTQARIL